MKEMAVMVSLFFSRIARPQPYPSILLAILMGLLFLKSIHADPAPDADWMRQIGTSGEDKSYSVAVDSLDNIYISGVTNGILDNANMGNDDIFLIKYDKNGQWLWSRQIGTVSYEEGLAVTTDPAGNVYISGFTTGDLGGSKKGGADAFLAKYDSSGNELWVRKIGTGGNDVSTTVATDDSGNIYISGNTSGKVGSGQFGDQDAFLIKFDTTGTRLWSWQIGTTRLDESNAVAADASGHIYLSGSTGGQFPSETNAGGYDTFLAKHEGSSGNAIWCKQIGTTGHDRSQSIAVADSGPIYISGYTTGSFDGTNAGGEDAFVCKFNDEGDCIWCRQLGTSGNDRSYSVALDSSGKIYICGTTGGSFDTYLNAGGEDVFLACYDTNGTMLWVRQEGTSGNDICRGVTIDTRDNVDITGYTNGSFDGTNAGGNDAFLIQFQSSSSNPPVPGDANHDNVVDVGDLGILAANYGQPDRSWEQGDFNTDGVVDVGDLGILAANYGYGKTGIPTASPVCSGMGISLVMSLSIFPIMLLNGFKKRGDD